MNSASKKSGIGRDPDLGKLPDAVLAAKYGISRQAVYSARLVRSIPPPTRRKISERRSQEVRARAEAVVTLRREGKQLKEIARIVKITVPSASRILKREGVAGKTTPEERAERNAEIRALSVSYSVRDLATRFGLSKAFIYAILGGK